jgi:hypothetical protein
MDSRVAAPLIKARALVATLAPELVEKTIWENSGAAGNRTLNCMNF